MTSDLESQFNELLAERMGLLDGSAADAGGLDPLKGGKGTGKEKAANADAFESRLLTRATTEVTMIDILTKISNDTSITAQNTSDIAGNTSPTDGEDETEISLTLINGGT